MYAEYRDNIQALLPFELNDQSLPTNDAALIIHGVINGFINGMLGVDVDIPGTPPDLTWLEIDLTINAIMEIHEGRAYNTPILLPTHIKVLDRYMISNIKFKEFNFGRT